MKFIYHILILLALVNFSTQIRKLPEANIYLDASPQEIWLPAFESLSKVHTWEESFEKVFKYKNETTFQYLSDAQFQQIQDAIGEHYPQYFEEIKGISYGFQRYFKKKVSTQYLSAWVYYHELSHVDFTKTQQKKHDIKESQFLTQFKNRYYDTDHNDCTGILIKKSDGSILHGRNMDQTPGEMRNVAMNLTMYKNNKIIGYVTDIYWFNAGFVTAMVPGVISMQENYRYYKMELQPMLDNISNGVMSQVWPFRIVMENEHLTGKDFDKIVHFLQSEPTAAPMYNILGGIENGVVLTLSAIGQEKPKVPKYDLSQDGEDGWFLIQTNYDQWEQDPQNDNRRTQGVKMLKQMGHQISQDKVGLFSILDAWKIHNQKTIYTGLMNAKENYHFFLGNDGILPLD